MEIRISQIILNTLSEGPGNRTAIWFQGCDRGCQGCFAPDTWDINKGYSLKVSEVIEIILSEDTRGITISGGEPFKQIDELFEITQSVKEMKDIIVFTGYTYEELLNMNGKCSKILNNIDLLIDGRFILKEKEDKRPLAGSKNQRFISLSERISKQEMLSQKNSVEVRFYPDGKISVNGMFQAEEFRERFL